MQASGWPVLTLAKAAIQSSLRGESEVSLQVSESVSRTSTVAPVAPAMLRFVSSCSHHHSAERKADQRL